MNEDNMLLKLKDGGIVNITEDTDNYPGCETCDYGSKYINEFNIELTKYKIEIKVVNMYEYLLSEGKMMGIILPKVDKIKKLTELEFTNWLKEKMKDNTKDIEDENMGYGLNYNIYKNIK